MPAALQHAYPQWMPPEEDPGAAIEEYRETWIGKMRIVHKQRARKLRRRGVPLMPLHAAGDLGRYRAWAWFTESP